MKTQLSFINIDHSPSLQEAVDKKFATIAKMIKGFETEGEVELYVEIARITKHHHKGEVYRISAHLELPGNKIQVSERGGNVRAILDVVKDTLRGAVGKYKLRVTEEKHR